MCSWSDPIRRRTGRQTLRNKQEPLPTQLWYPWQSTVCVCVCVRVCVCVNQEDIDQTFISTETKCCETSLPRKHAVNTRDYFLPFLYHVGTEYEIIILKEIPPQ
jgi:hypothetical protein